MKRLLIALAAFALGASPAYTQDDPLPDSVARAYVAYERALQAGDAAAASDAAREAWQAARSERIDPELTGILAENYGDLALRRGMNEEAYEAWRAAAEISDRLDAPGPERAQRWYRASMSALGSGDVRDAQQCSLRASRAVGNNALDPALEGEIHYMIALTSGQLGRLHTMKAHAPLAVAAFQEASRPYDAVYATAHYLSGVGRFFELDAAGAALDFHMARAMYGSLEGHLNDARSAHFWISLARSEADEDDLAAIDAEIDASDFPDTEPDFPGTSEEDVHYDVDAAAARRRQPLYPTPALEAGIDGIVVARFDVTETGRVDSVEIIAAAPGGVFDSAVLRAMQQWEYTPAQIDGETVRRTGLLTRFNFSTCEEEPVSNCRD
tara:strand:- start:7741 stop:8889 length:1149 start_codon:yes stop_codon:yes gene_type:complete